MGVAVGRSAADGEFVGRWSVVGTKLGDLEGLLDGADVATEGKLVGSRPILVGKTVGVLVGF